MTKPLSLLPGKAYSALRVYLIISFLSLTTFGFAQTATAPATGDGTSANPYQIATLDNLYWLSQNSAQWVSGKYFIQTADIDASSTATWFSDGSTGYYGFPIIGGYSNSVGNHVSGTFAGNYDGEGYSITDLYINRAPHYVALFGYCSNATLKNIRLINPTVNIGATGGSSSNGYQGNAILLASGSATIDNIHIYGGTVTANTWHGYIGGMLGRTASITASNCTANVTMNLTTTYGGPCGIFMAYSESSTTVFTNCSSSGSISSSNLGFLGGFVGETYAGSYTYNQCYSTANVSGVNYCGGFSGGIYDGGSTFNNCYATGSVTANYSGGFFGYVNSGSSTLRNCYATGLVTGTYCAGFGYSAGSHSFTNCFFDNQTTGNTNAFYSGSNSGVTGATTTQMTTASTFTDAGWDFINETTNGTNDYWFIDATTNSGYPSLVGNIRDWTGGTSTDWTDASNWENGILPNTSSIVRLTSGATYLPVISSDITLDRFSFNDVSSQFDLGNNNLTCSEVLDFDASKYIKTSGSGVLKMNVGNTKFLTFPTGNSAFDPVSIANNSGSADDFSVFVLDEVYANGSSGSTMSGARVKRTWNISKANANSGSGINLLLNWNSGETSGTLSLPKLFHYSAGTWTQQSGTTTSATNSLTYTGYTGSFSPFSVMNDLSILPVVFKDFSAVRVNSTAQLSWTTSSELNNSKFIIEHSTDGVAFSAIGEVNSTATDASAENQYSFIHTTPVTGNNYYRLKQVDNDGKFSYSEVRLVVFNNDNDIRVYPTPVQSDLVVSPGSQGFSSGKLMITDMSGRLVYSKIISGNSNSFTISASQWSSGLYQLTIFDASGSRVYSNKIIKQ